MSQIDQKAFRSALGQFATGVTVITTVDAQGNKVGMTANSFSSVSLDPMLVLWSIARSSNSFNEFVNADRFAIHVLHANQQTLSNQFASSCDDRFYNVSHSDGLGGVPLLNDYSAVFQCQTEHQYDGGDHIIIVGRVVAFENREQPPLIFHAGRYADLDLPVAV
ncbi:flavin reductase family protein [Ketobacter alkanivorans]|uniref:Nitrilotriacetate monooxygenase n=1 Tax=Ketobacter alkanivorans TaxID=1917421 RepID=A0A2K9LJ00_9GAMM|nr:flavin reductase family protein [Ketobacter alkanivorans]AUM12329.1 nitrilotriacetate monooxygenase [Ketobacter alkanivorans]MCP5018621.1 flavin reductase family protein [Ketobacter sp.]